MDWMTLVEAALAYKIIALVFPVAIALLVGGVCWLVDKIRKPKRSAREMLRAPKNVGLN